MISFDQVLCQRRLDQFFVKQKAPNCRPGLVVMGGDSCSKGHGFESQRHILDGHDIFHIDFL